MTGDPRGGTLEELLRAVPYFRDLPRVEIARLLGALEPLEVPAGTLLFEENAPADGLYLLERGTVRVDVRADGGERALAEVGPGGHLGELGLLLDTRTASARVTSDARLWRLPRDRFDELARAHSQLGLGVARSLAMLLDRRTREHVGAPLRAPAAAGLLAPQRPPRPVRARLAGAALALGAPLLLWAVPPPGGLSVAAWHVALVLVGGALGWLLEPVPDFVVTVAMAAAWGIAGLAPLASVFGGFATPSWLLALGALTLAASMVDSGLLFRVALLLLRAFPPSHAGQLVALLVGGAMITPMLPLALARVATAAPLARELSRALGYRPRSRATAALAFAGIVGYGGFSSVFLTGLAMNFFVLDLVRQAGQRVTWLEWLGAAMVTGIVLLVGAAVALLALLRPDRPPAVTAEVLHRQQRALGPLGRTEAVSIVAAVVLVGGLVAEPLLHIDAAWLGLVTVVIVVSGGALDRLRFRSAVDWGFLVLFGILLGAGGVLRDAGVDRWIASLFVPAARALGDPGALVVLTALLVIAVRLVVPWIPATLLLALALVPAAADVGLSPWVVGFVVLVAANTWIVPNQSDMVRLTRELTEGEAFGGRQALVMGAATTAVTLLAIAASIPYWRALRLVP